MVYERPSGQEYRFVPQGPEIQDEEWQAGLADLEILDFSYLMASGSLPKGPPADFYGPVAQIAAEKRARLVLDTSGEALKRALDHRASSRN
jgi:6-phosphofructokinase 2